MAACKSKTLLMAVLLLYAAAAYADATTAAAGDGGELMMRAADEEGPTVSLPTGEYGRCLPGCPGGLDGCDEPCKKEGYDMGGECVASIHQCCCLGLPLPA
ncbi:hypothetical protein PAHAL_8G247000 [Panicum hallii]|uniref:Knottin scorpion toxin-like domain-containing protein n=1 Tax=Panicum hallii TaxID=206008 RepID=A0A2T8IA59_9POAL|nr:hypothetical protein PAHAL_8G247000 [Panicum hallii]